MKNLSVRAKTASYKNSSLLLRSVSRSRLLRLAMRRWMAIVGFLISLSSAGILLLHTNPAEITIAEIPVSSETLSSVLSQNSDRKYELARAAIASGELDQAIAVAPNPVPTQENATTTEKTATPTATLVSNPSGVIIHEVKQDETLWQLTQMYQVDAASIAASNNISSATELQPGMKLVIPPVDGLVHRVRKGETLASIADFYKVPKSEILRHSPVADGELLAIDQPLMIPGDVTTLLQVKNANAKRELFAERERLRARLARVEGTTVPVATTTDPLAQRIVKPAKKPTKNSFTYTVRSGDTVGMIARQHGVSQAELVALNNLENAHWIQVGQELQIPTVNPNAPNNPAPNNLVANSDTGRKVQISSPLPPWNGLAVLAGKNPAPNPTSSPVVKAETNSSPTPNSNVSSGRKTPPVGETVALNPAPINLPLQQLTEQLPNLGNLPASPRPLPSGLIAPEPNLQPSRATTPAAPAKVTTPQLPSKTLTEQESAPNRPVAAISSAPAQEPTPSATSPSTASQVVAVRIPLPELPLAQLADQVGTTLSEPAPLSALAPESESRMASQEVRQLEREVQELSARVRQAEERQRQESLRLAAASLNPTSRPLSIPNVVIPPETPNARPNSNAPTNSNRAPQLPTLNARTFLPEIRDYGINSGFMWPANGVMTSGFGPRWGRIHRGIDIAGPVGTPIVAAASGRVAYSGWNDGGFGNMVEIVHPDGSMTLYAHNSALYVRVGEEVNQGQLIAAMGSTGFSTGPHVHFEIHPTGRGAVDPMPFLVNARRP